MGFINTFWGTFSVLDLVCVVSSTQVEIHFVSSLAWEGIVQHILRCIFCSCWQRRGIVYTYIDIHFVTLLTLYGFGQQILKWVLYPSLQWWDFSTHVEIRFVFCLALEGFGQHMFRFILCPRCQGSGLRYILCPHWHGKGLFNTFWDAFFVLAGKGGVLSIYILTYIL